MKKITNFLYLMLLLGSFLTITSCSSDDDNDAVLDDYIGSYTVVEQCDLTGEDNYSITIREGNSENTVVIYNLYDFGEDMDATIDGNDLALVEYSGFGYIFSGDASLSGDVLTFSFDAISEGATNSCGATADKN